MNPIQTRKIATAYDMKQPGDYRFYESAIDDVRHPGGVWLDIWLPLQVEPTSFRVARHLPPVKHYVILEWNGNTDKPTIREPFFGVIQLIDGVLQNIQLQLPVKMLEVEEFLFSTTAAKFAQDHDEQLVRDHIRGSLRMHRFMVFTWLLQNGVSVPVHLLSDTLHPEIGRQSVDQKS